MAKAIILDGQLKFTVTEQDAHPDVFINNSVGHIICHLTQGFDAGKFPKEQGNAITAGAHVPLSAGPGDTAFGFVQLARANFYGAFYAGRISREGSIGIQAHIPPALPNALMLDATGNPPLPWFNDPSFSSFVAPTVNSTWGDHPASKVPLKLKNSFTSNVDNFLFQLIDDREFWTIFTAKDSDGTIRYIAHFHWKVRYDVEFMWRNGEAVLRRSRSSITVPEKNVKGRPMDADLQPLLTLPAGPRANVVFGQAITSAFYGARGANRSENPRWFTTVPGDFWA
jgi:hypothetical protein